MPMRGKLIREARCGRAVRLPRVREIIGVSAPTVWRYVKNDPSFPKPFHLSPAVTCWDEDELFAWLESKKARGGVK